MGGTLIAVVVAMGIGAPPTPGGAVPDSYVQNVEAWRQERQARLAADDGWLTVAGLFWLKPGTNRFGAAADNDLVLPGSAPAHAGTFVREGGRVQVDVLPGVPVMRAGKPLARVELRSDAGEGPPDLLTLGPLTMQVIVRGDRLGVRLKDRDSAARRGFRGTRWYPVRPAYRVVARFVPAATPVTISVPTVIGTVESMASPGTARFELGGQAFSLDPVSEPGETRLFFILRDATSGKTTYGGGRFLYADPPKDGRIVLDFNRAYSPPCAFTRYATCPLPPPQNRLPVAVEAGELNPGHPP